MLSSAFIILLLLTANWLNAFGLKNPSTSPTFNPTRSPGQFCNVSSSEMSALYDLYVSTDGLNWQYPRDSVEWNFNEPNPNPCFPSSWAGITCIPADHGDSCVISKLELSSFNLVGTLPNTIGDLSYLNILDLSSNSVNGSLTDNIGNLQLLETIALFGNGFTNYIPKSIGNLNRLTVLSMDHNRFNGSIPSTVDGLSSLSSLQLYGNRLSGSIPASLYTLSTLTIFEAYENKLTGSISEDIVNLRLLKTLALSVNLLTGSIPNGIYELIKLNALSLFDNALNGTISNKISNMESLNVLQLYLNELTGSIPESMYDLIGLLKVELYFNQLTGTLSHNINKLKLVEQFEVYDNLLTGTLPSTIGECTHLNTLKLSNNFFNGSIPSSIGNLTAIAALQFINNYFSGPLLDSICALSTMTYFSAVKNSLTGTLPACIGEMKSLQQLIVSNNQLHGTIPVSIGLSTTLSDIEFANNNFTGTIPISLCNIATLSKLTLNNNQLNGTIPNAIGNMTKLAYLELNNNMFTGSLPDTIGAMSSLTTLDVAYNQLTNSIPSSINQLHRTLSVIVLQYNQLTGEIPFNQTFPVLYNVALYNNYFTGQYPDYEMPIMVEFQIANNNFHGSIPNFCKSIYLDYLSASNNHLTGTFPDCDIRPTFELDLSYNQFTGHFPFNSVITNIFLMSSNYFTGVIEPRDLINITQFLVNDNIFSGTVPIPKQVQQFYLQNNVLTGSLSFGVSELPSVQYLDVSSNQITGTLPTALFDSNSALLSFAASSNCITGTITAEICNMKHLIYLGLDGLSTASSCRTPIFPGSEVFKSYYLNKQISGGIPECLFTMSTLQTLQLSGNSIDWSFPTKDFSISNSLTSMSLSHNKLTGSIPDVIQLKSWASLDLSFNRLVGVVSSEVNAEDGSLVLQVNRLSGSIPNTLEDVKSIDILTGNVFGCNFDRGGLPVNDAAHDTYQCGSNSFNQASIAWCSFVFVAGMIILMIWLNSRLGNAYLILQYNTLQTYLKEFDTSSSLFNFKNYLLQLSKVILLLTLLLVLVFGPLYLVLTKYYKTVEHQYAWTVSAAYLSGVSPAIILLLFLLLLIVIIVAAFRWTVNTNKVTTELKQSKKLDWIQIISLSCVLLVNCSIMSVANGAFVYIILTYDTSTVFVTLVCLAIFKLVWNEYGVRSLMFTAHRFYHSNADNTVLQDLPWLTFIALFNTILAPCLATAAVDSNCFYNVIYAPNDVTSAFPVSNENCVLSTIIIAEVCITNASVSYTDVSYSPPFIYNYQCASSILTNYATMYVFMYLISAFVKPALMWLMVNSVPYFPKVGAFMNQLMLPKDFRTQNRTIFVKERFILRLLSKIAVFITFGVIFPPLAIVLCVAFLSEVAVNLIVIGRFLGKIKDFVYGKELREQLHRECENSLNLMWSPLISLVVPFSAIFYAIFVFDIYGDAVGFRKALWAPLLLIVWPAVLWLLSWLYSYYYSGKSVEEDEEGSLRDSEMVIVNNVLRESK